MGKKERKKERKKEGKRLLSLPVAILDNASLVKSLGRVSDESDEEW